MSPYLWSEIFCGVWIQVSVEAILNWCFWIFLKQIWTNDSLKKDVSFIHGDRIGVVEDAVQACLNVVLDTTLLELEF